VVEGVLKAGANIQSILIHRTLADNVIRGESGASVTIRPAGRGEIVLTEGAIESCAEQLGAFADAGFEVRATCYSAHFEVEPETEYELLVSTADGLSIRGRTTVPGEFAILRPTVAHGGSCRLEPRVNLPLVWSRSTGTWAYFAQLGATGLPEAFAGTGIDAPEYLRLTGLAISGSDTTLVLPREFGVFDRFSGDLDLLRELQLGFPAGVSVAVAVSAADRNYVNGVRGGAFNPSGNVRISSVAGDGVGMFGSVVTRHLTIQVDTAGGPTCM
jgi:hypothetical protein